MSNSNKNETGGGPQADSRRGPAEQANAAPKDKCCQQRPQFDQAAADQMAADLAGGEQGQADHQLDELESGLESLRDELRLAQDRALRSQAELENFRKRIARQMEDERRYANIPLLRDLLPVLDNLQRAIDAAEKTHDTASLLQGVTLVSGQFEDALGRHHCTKIPALSEPFDPHLHEAIMQQPTADQPPGTVIMVTQAGFRLHDRVVRPSQVIVAAEDVSPESKNG